MLAKNIMTINLFTATPDTPVEEIAKLLLEKRISAVPVTDTEGRIQGIVSEGDLMRRPESGTEPQRSWWLTLFDTPQERSAEYLKTHGLTARDVMTRDVVTVAPGTPAAEIAGTLEQRHIKRVPVVEDGNLVGIVSRANLLHAIAAHKDKLPVMEAVDDQVIRENLLKALIEEGLPSHASVNPIVSDSVVYLWGMVESREERDAVRLAAESIDGVNSVENYIGIMDGAVRRAMWAE